MEMTRIRQIVQPLKEVQEKVIQLFMQLPNSITLQNSMFLRSEHIL